MKKTGLFLLTLFVAVCLWQGYQRLTSQEEQQNHTEGYLSDIAEEVVAIPLESANGIHIETARQIRQEGKNLFLINNNVLYRFHRNGQFICRISDPEEISVAGYLIHPAQRQLIVMGNTNDIFYYTYEGKLIDKKKLTSNLPDRRIFSMSVHQNKIWSVEEQTTAHKQSGQADKVNHQVVIYDTSFHKIAERKLTHADMGRRQPLPAFYNPQLCISADTGSLYAYQPTVQPNYLLRDSLYISRLKRGSNPWGSEKEVYLYPLRMGRRMWISCYQPASDSRHNYTFCYDSYRQRSWQIKGGFIDNFYQTGAIARLEPLDLQGDQYYFVKPSTLYIVKIKG